VTAPDQCCNNVKKALAMAPSTRDPGCVKTLQTLIGAQQKNQIGGRNESFMRKMHSV
jgi:hypothetical protein